MKTQDYQVSIPIAIGTAQEIFNSITNVSAWWTEDVEGSSQKLYNIFTVRFGEVYITMKVTELIPGKKIVWYVTDCNKPWLKNKKEWNGTQLVWEISEKDNAIQLDFTHVGLVPQIECYGACSDAWSQYIRGSLAGLINTGKGKPTKIVTKKSEKVVSE